MKTTWADWNNWDGNTEVEGDLGKLSATIHGEMLDPWIDGSNENYWAIEQGAWAFNKTLEPTRVFGESLPNSDVIRFVDGSVSIQFSEPVENPVLAVISLGQWGNVINYKFDQPFSIVSEGQGYWGGLNGGISLKQDGPLLIGREGNGLIRFHGQTDLISWEVQGSEWWHGVTVGVPTAPVPEPSIDLSLIFLAIVKFIPDVLNSLKGF